MSRRWKLVRSRWEDSLTQVGWDEFERRVAEYYRGQGYRVEHVGTGSTHAMSDGGIDLKLFREHEYTIVQCKHWNVAQVPHNAVHELIGVMHTEGADRAILISSGEFTDHAMRSAAKYLPIQLIGGIEIRAMLGPIPELEAPPPVAHTELPSWMAGGRQRRPRQPASAGTIVTNLIVIASMLLIAYLYIPYVISHFSAGVVRTTAQNEASARARARVHDVQASTAVFPRDYPAARMTMPPGSTHAETPITTADGMPRATGSTPMTQAEIAAWQAENAKAMKILEKTTPALETN